MIVQSGMGDPPSHLRPTLDLLTDAHRRFHHIAIPGSSLYTATGYLRIAIDLMEKEDTQMALTAMVHALHVLSRAVPATKSQNATATAAALVD